jgi:hypothetical protein
MSSVSFGKKGIVSVWVGQTNVEQGSNFLRDKFGVEYYDPDDQDCIVGENRSPIRDLASRLSYSDTFLDLLLEKAGSMGVTSSLWILAQYDFEYDPDRVGVSVLPREPLYVGSFDWHD